MTATPHAAQYLVCKAERDLPTLLPLLPELAAGTDGGRCEYRAAGMTERSSPAA